MQSRFDTTLPPDLLETVQSGVMRYNYRGVPCHKSPFDLAIYQSLLFRQCPATIIEIGTKAGGSALWFSDMSRVICGQARVISIDDQASIPPFPDPNIWFINADAACLEASALESALRELQHPWLVVEDSAHTYQITRAVLEHFEPKLIPGDYIVVEDGIVRAMTGDKYRAYDDGPCRAISDFLDQHKEFEVDRTLCDMFGHNVTYNPCGYLKRL